MERSPPTEPEGYFLDWENSEEMSSYYNCINYIYEIGKKNDVKEVYFGTNGQYLIRYD